MIKEYSETALIKQHNRISGMIITSEHTGVSTAISIEQAKELVSENKIQSMQLDESGNIRVQCTAEEAEYIMRKNGHENLNLDNKKLLEIINQNNSLASSADGDSVFKHEHIEITSKYPEIISGTLLNVNKVKVPFLTELVLCSMAIFGDTKMINQLVEEINSLHQKGIQIIMQDRFIKRISDKVMIITAPIFEDDSKFKSKTFGINMIADFLIVNTNNAKRYIENNRPILDKVTSGGLKRTLKKTEPKETHINYVINKLDAITEKNIHKIIG